MLGCGEPTRRHRELRGGLAPGHVLGESGGTRTTATVLIATLGRLLSSLLFSSVARAVRRVGDIVFVATANDRATEKDSLFLELSFSLKEIKINIERIFLKKKKICRKNQFPLSPPW